MIPLMAGMDFLRAHGEAIVVVLILATYTAFIYHEGGRGPAAELSAYGQRVAEAQRLRSEDDTKKAAASAVNRKQLEDDNAKKDSDLRAAWAALRLRQPTLGGSPVAAPEPVRIVADVCDDPSANQRLSDSLQTYRRGVRATHEWYRGRVTELLAQCSVQTSDYFATQDWAINERAINSAPAAR